MERFAGWGEHQTKDAEMVIAIRSATLIEDDN
jgi:hypothetical protein